MNEPVGVLQSLREQIDQIDLELLHLLSARATVVLQIQRAKREFGLPSYSAARESDIVQRLRNANKGPLPDDAIEDIFRRILQHSLSSLVVEDG
jgi:chorismate mutase/prephenate dehydratase